MAGELSGVKEKLASAYENVFRDNPELAQQLRQAVGDDTIEEYEEAFDTTNAQEALAQAAASGDLGDDYSGVYDRFPELRELVREAGESAFSDSDKEKLREVSTNTNINQLYTDCIKGDFDEVSGVVDDSNFSSVRECQQAVSEASGLAGQYERLYESA